MGNTLAPKKAALFQEHPGAAHCQAAQSHTPSGHVTSANASTSASGAHAIVVPASHRQSLAATKSGEVESKISTLAPHSLKQYKRQRTPRTETLKH